MDCYTTKHVELFIRGQCFVTKSRKRADTGNFTKWALSSSVSLIEPFTAWIEEENIFSRLKGVIILGLIAWFIGLGTVFSDNIWAEYKFYGMNFFEVIAVLTDQFMLPLGGLLICMLVGFCVPKLDFIKEIDLSNNLSKVFNVCLKFVAPVSVLLIFGYALS